MWGHRSSPQSFMILDEGKYILEFMSERAHKKNIIKKEILHYGMQYFCKSVLYMNHRVCENICKIMEAK